MLDTWRTQHVLHIYFGLLTKHTVPVEPWVLFVDGYDGVHHVAFLCAFYVQLYKSVMFTYYSASMLFLASVSKPFELSPCPLKPLSLTVPVVCTIYYGV